MHWTKWTGPDLIAPSEPWDKTYAHKPWVLKHDGVVYHFYCAVGTEGRVIAVATSRDLRASPPAPAFGQPYVPSGQIDPARVNVLSAADGQRSAGLSLAFPVSHLKPEVVGWTRATRASAGRSTCPRPRAVATRSTC